MWPSILAALISAAVLFGLARWWWRARLEARSLQAEPGVRGPYPIVLVHGFAGWRELEIMGRRVPYFRGITEALEADGVEVYQVRLPPLASVEQRAAVLARFIAALDAPRVNVLAHSMGGIDTRYAISELAMAPKIAALVTLGTPHHGTPLADLGNLAPARMMRAMLERAGIGARASEHLTSEQMAQFNTRVRDADGVFYASVVGRSRSVRAALPLVLGRTEQSDGVVPCASQIWGEVLFEVEADHWELIGWSKSFDAPALYREIVKQLRARGL